MITRTSIVLNPKIIKYSRCLSTKKPQSPAGYCLDLVRKHDYESFLCTLMLPENIRTAAFAIRAFNVEIALVESQVSKMTIGRMRYKFWEEALDKVYNDIPPKSPAPLELHRILKKHKLSKRYFKRLLDARVDRIGKNVFVDLESLEKYSENSTSSIYYLLLEANDTKSVDIDHAASHLGKAHGIVTLIRSIPYHAERRNCILPQDVLMKHNVPMESIFRGQTSKSLTDAIFEVSSRAKLHLDKTKSLSSSWKKKNAQIFLPTVMIDTYLEKLRQVDFDIFSPRLQRKNTLLPAQLIWTNFKWKFS